MLKIKDSKLGKARVKNDGAAYGLYVRHHFLWVTQHSNETFILSEAQFIRVEFQVGIHLAWRYRP